MATVSSSVNVVRARAMVKTSSKAKAAARSNMFGAGIKGLSSSAKFQRVAPASRLAVRAADEQQQVVTPLNGDPFVGMLETPVTSAPIVTNFLSKLPAYRTGVAPLQRGVEIGLTHGFFITGPFIKLGPLRNTEMADAVGCLSGAGLVVILTACLAIYGAASFQEERPSMAGAKSLTGRTLAKDSWQTNQGWNEFSAGWLVGGLSGVAWAYLMTQTLPYYS